MTDLNRVAPKPITLGKLQQRLIDIDVPEAELRPYLIEASGDSGSFRPQVRINPNHIADATPGGPMAESAMLLSSLNGVARWRRHERYRRKIKDWTGLRVVSEGDSWTQYPFLLDDVVDQLWDDYAIFSLDAAGDLLTDMAKQGEVVAAVIAEKPDVVLLSGGGNDLLGDARLARILLPYDKSLGPEDYLGKRFDEHLASVFVAYDDVVSRIRKAAPKAAIVCHTYDYALPNAGRWLGKPMASIGIVDPELQRKIVHCCIDRFHKALTALASKHKRLSIVDARKAVAKGQWHDELHPTNAGFAAVAGRFRSVIADAMGQKLGTESESPKLAGADPAPGKGSDVASAAMFLSQRYSDDALLNELGRREAIVEAGGDVDGLGSLTISDSSVESALPVFKEAGKRIVDALHRQLFQVVCGRDDDDASDRNALRDALGLGDLAVAGVIATALASLAVPTGICAIAAPIIARRAVAPSMNVLCDLWGERLGIDKGDKGHA